MDSTIFHSSHSSRHVSSSVSSPVAPTRDGRRINTFYITVVSVAFTAGRVRQNMSFFIKR
ncbi:hypothetical protein LIPSTDRAFT_73024 [Lipomyces starkeyi NRRL Y-11557]|uniref:Uncharacterized protein n=1 Tax=Lipomyces starkeyi NRRL Y-11557 TaxID=675824 RepID=A0A1E3Q3M9_LIPST|nr:hypothetical protein LIPSTDRAFT_73024 [Lipomyces starkeyi NRRL Y-11557]